MSLPLIRVSYMLHVVECRFAYTHSCMHPCVMGTVHTLLWQVFFASYRMLTKCCDRWMASGMWEDMCGLKAMYTEAKCNQSEFDALLAKFRSAVCLAPSLPPLT
jgi:hypothetical protein